MRQGGHDSLDFDRLPGNAPIRADSPDAGYDGVPGR